MIEIEIPGYKTLQLKHLVLDHNGTLAYDGILLESVKECLEKLANDLQIHVLTADTFGKAGSQLEGVPCGLSILPTENQDVGKLDYVKGLGCENTVCIGNGRNDRLMLKEAALGIAVVLQEGVAVATLVSADVVCTSIVSALELLMHPLRLTATLRSQGSDAGFSILDTRYWIPFSGLTSSIEYPVSSIEYLALYGSNVNTNDIFIFDSGLSGLRLIT